MEYHNTRELGGTVFTFDTTYSGMQYLRRSGVVTAVPKDLVYAVPFNLEHKLRKIQVEVGDTVFFDARAFGYCEHNNLIEKTDKTWSYIMPYRYLICAIKKADERIQMLNGRILIKMRQDITNSIWFEQSEMKRRDDNYRYAEITHVDNNEGYNAFAYDVFKFDSFEYNNQHLSVGDIVVLNHFSDFDLQSIFQEVSQHDELEKSFVVNRHDIVCFKSAIDEKFTPYGFWLSVEPTNDYLPSNDTLYIPDKKVSGKALKCGNGVGNTFEGANINFKDRKQIIIDDVMYVHQEWIVLSE